MSELRCCLYTGLAFDAIVFDDDGVYMGGVLRDFPSWTPLKIMWALDKVGLWYDLSSKMRDTNEKA